ncbi:CGNR zinc finger domain-containing protein [Kribbella sp. HUAS MG21]|uniref:CGNR zinc finger domain-containing protein n=1 Tax=Kribbella sp. HUAS MG21 TaxID=3160966 RepID=A0AAU7TG68_9ACTN
METPELPPGIRELPVVAGDLALDFANTVDDPLGPERHDHLSDYRALLWWSLRVGILTETDADRLLTRSAPRRAAAVVRRAHQLREAINRAARQLADGAALTNGKSRASDTAVGDVRASGAAMRGAHASEAAGAAGGGGADAAGGTAGRAAPAGGAARAEGVVGGGVLSGWDELRGFVGVAVGRSELVGLRPVWRFEVLESPLWPVALAGYELLTGPRAGRIKRCAGCPWLFLDQSKNGSRRWCSMEICGTNEKMRLYVSRRAARRTQN